MEVNENENMAFQKMWGTAKAVLRGKFLVTMHILKGQRDLISMT
jgi:hypothetical protein